jgi:hypothetical protein
MGKLPLAPRFPERRRALANVAFSRAIADTFAGPACERMSNSD